MIRELLFQMAFGRRPSSVLHVSTGELAMYLLHRGVIPRLRGMVNAWRFRSCGTRLCVGRGAAFYFPSQIELGSHVVLEREVTLNGLSQKGLHLGNHVHIRERTALQATSVLDMPGIGMTIGAHTYIGPDCILGAGGGIEIGSNVLLGAGVHILAENHRFDAVAHTVAEQGVSRRGIVIEDGCWIGNRAIILDGVTLGRGCVVGAGSIVTKSFPAGSVIVGNPAKLLRTRGSDHVEPAA
jgi:acetyltransferase-like isoleucine patch superfamily enzyme